MRVSTRSFKAQNTSVSPPLSAFVVWFYDSKNNGISNMWTPVIGFPLPVSVYQKQHTHFHSATTNAT